MKLKSLSNTGLSIILVSSSYPTDKNPVSGPIVPVYAKTLVALGCSVYLLIPRREGKPCPVKGVTIIEYGQGEMQKSFTSHSFLNFGKTISLIRLLFEGRKKLMELASRIKPDMIMALWAIPSGWYAYEVKKTLGFPYTVISLGSDIHTWSHYPFVGSLIRKVLRKSDFLFADGYSLADLAKKISGKGCQFFPTTIISRKIFMRKADTIGQVYRFLFVGRLEKVKGADLLIPAFAEACRKTEIPITLTVVGDGSLMSIMKKQVEDYGLEKSISMEGAKNAEDVARYMKKCRCLLIPSRKESIPMVFSEALAYGMRIIASDARGSDFKRFSGKFKVLKVVERNDVNSLSEAIVSYVSGGEVWSLQDRNKIMEIFNVDLACKKFLKSIHSR